MEIEIENKYDILDVIDTKTMFIMPIHQIFTNRGRYKVFPES